MYVVCIVCVRVMHLGVLFATVQYIQYFSHVPTYKSDNSDTVVLFSKISGIFKSFI